MSLDELKKYTDERNALVKKGASIDEGELKEFQDAIARIGRRESVGVMFILEEKDESRENDPDLEDVECSAGFGIVFSNGMDRATFALNFLTQVFPNKHELLFMLDTVRDIVEKK